jgi:hypothetical protein
MTINVDPDGLAADGTALAGWLPGVSAPGVQPASAHSTSYGVAAHFTAHSVSLGLTMDHAQQVRAEGGAATVHAAASFRAQDEAGADIIAGNASASGAVSTPMTPASVPAPVLPAIPPMPPLATMTGEAHATALHTGLGSQPLRDLSDYWQSRAVALENTAAEMSQTSASVDANWIDGRQTAGANIAAHGTFLSHLAWHARALSSAASDAADNHDQTVAATPTPQEFADAHNRLDQAIQANAASHGLLSSQVSAAAAFLAQLQCQATEAAAAHHVASSATTSAVPPPPGAAQPIATGSSVASSACQCGMGNASQNTGAMGLAQLASSLVPAAATNAGTGTSSMDQMMQSMLPMMMMLPMMGMMPMSALSGLGGLSRQNTPSTFAANSAGWPGDAALDAGMSDDLGDTLPAAGGGGGVEAAGTAQALPMGSPSAASPTAVSGPAASVSLPAEAAATAPAGASGGGMAAYPPMMGGGLGAGDGGGQRDMRLFPDRRVVWRPTPNTEAVFGELKRERRPRGKRAAQEESTDEG